MFLDMMSHDFTEMAMLDIGILIDFISKTIPVDKKAIMKWANDTLYTRYKPHFSEITTERLMQELYPPGNCIHIWRNGVGWSGTYTPCTHEVFGEVEFSRNLISDHLLEPGYHPALLGLAREIMNDQNFDFAHDLLGLSV